jgi:hypothetical protein
LEVFASRKHEGLLKSWSLFSTRVVSFGVVRALIIYGGNQRRWIPRGQPHQNRKGHNRCG